ncbi:MAG: HAMP domain-containing histidine kinase [Sphingomonadaceae bacterium]|uniref:sensor histidine kinase n=1 Tax=Thermaurantiacus sp. TaxID=2820283 RepID=UPI00298EE704|nr:HAMP domain-containing sensor histidine kinase [Thermaurantiacus sp.]MCS6986499.1 HAMP domain-containing histidine kinase [Sphingomonadaceae bacterium]MDW8414240.1 HAMP domain-containing sensor histidine kinase [Thermaurantiacus sp.]
MRPPSLSARLLAVSVVWIAALTLGGGLLLERAIEDTLVRNFDRRLADVLPRMVAGAELDAAGDLVGFGRFALDPAYGEPYSGRYWQVSAKGRADRRSRSLWDRTLVLDLDRPCPQVCTGRSDQFPGEPLRIVERDVVLPGSTTVFRFAVAEAAGALDQEVARVRRLLWTSLGLLALGLLALAALQASVGLRPLRRLSASIAAIRSGRLARVPERVVPPEVEPLVAELNALIAQNEAVVEAARTHAGNLAHALKTPISVMMNEAEAGSPDLAQTVRREVATMRRHIDHHLARARAAARRPDSTARTPAWPSLERLARAIERIHADRGVVIDIDGDREAVFRGEMQDFEEMAGNLLDNAAKYGGGRVFATLRCHGEWLELVVEDDGPGIPVPLREGLFRRGARLDQDKPGTGLGLAIVRDIAAMHGGAVELGESEDLGGLQVVLRLPAVPPAPRGGRRSATARLA